VASLRDRLARSDALAFAGRVRELRLVDSFLAPDASYQFLFVHGPHGIGKSALLREVARRGRAAGYDVRTVGELDARDGVRGRLLFIEDDVSQLADEVATLRDRLLDVPDDARVVLASRERPHPGWWRDGLDALARELRLEPLPDDDARRMLAARGLVDPTWQDAAVAWAQGSPLALSVASGLEPGTTSPPLESALEDRLAGLLTGAAIDTVEPEILEVAALASPVDARLLAAALPGRSTRGAMAQLFDLPVVSRQGHAASLHPALRAAIATRLRVHEGSRYRELMRRIALHLAARARLGEADALVQLSGLIEDPALVAGKPRGGSRAHVEDCLRPGDLERLADETAAELAWFVERHPENVTVIRRPDGSLAGLIGGAPLSVLSADSGTPAPAMIRLLEEEGCDPDRTIVGPVVLLESDPAAMQDLLEVAYSGALRRGGVADIRYLLSYYPEPSQRPEAFLRAAPWRSVPFGPPDSSWLIDWGPAGAIGFALNTVLREQGYPDRPHGDSPLAPGGESRLAAVLVDAFGDSREEQLLRRVIELTHLSPGVTQAQILSTLHISRATYFRMLRRARERVLVAQDT